MRNFKLSRKKQFLLITLALLLAVPLLRLTRSNDDQLNNAQRKLAGTHATDCGVGQIETLENNRVFENRAEVDACAVAAFKAKEPFLARYDTDADGGANYYGKMSFGIARTPQGEIYFFYYNSSTGLWRKVLDFQQTLCPEPKITIHRSLNAEEWQTVGCGTCSPSEDTPNCALHP